MGSWSTDRDVEKPKPHTIWKFPLPTRGRASIEMPRYAEILSVDVQDETPVLWAICCTAPGWPTASRVFSARVTGGTVPSEIGKFVGTFQINRGDYVAHVFDMGES